MLRRAAIARVVVSLNPFSQKRLTRRKSGGSSAGQKSGVFRQDVEPRYLASMLRGLLDRTVEWYQKGGSLGPAELAGCYCDIFLFGARKASAQRAGA